MTQPIQPQPQIPEQAQGAASPYDLEAAMSIRGLLKIFDKKVAVNNIDLDIPTGSFYAFVGPNGAGKTTTLRMATGLLRPTSGGIAIHGTDLWGNLNDCKHMLGIMPDADELFTRLTGLQSTGLCSYAARCRPCNSQGTRQRPAHCHGPHRISKHPRAGLLSRHDKKDRSGYGAHPLTEDPHP